MLIFKEHNSLRMIAISNGFVSSELKFGFDFLSFFYRFYSSSISFLEKKLSFFYRFFIFLFLSFIFVVFSPFLVYVYFKFRKVYKVILKTEIKTIHDYESFIELRMLSLLFLNSVEEMDFKIRTTKKKSFSRFVFLNFLDKMKSISVSIVFESEKKLNKLDSSIHVEGLKNVGWFELSERRNTAYNYVL